MKEKLKGLKKMTEKTIQDYFKEYIEDFRVHNIPERYNQIRLLDELANPEIDHYISISNRTDGKSFNYIHALLNIAIDYDIGLFFLTRNMMLRFSYQTLIEEISEVSNLLEKGEFTFIRQQYWITVKYKGKDIAVISDLNNATELKMFSNYLKKFPILIYDEFIALEDDYLSDEWARLKTIYESVDRKDEIPLIVKPKLFYFGNAINFNSPVLHSLQLFNILETHPINTARIYKYTFNIMLEMNRNDNANQKRNTRAFDSDDDAMTTGEFETNNFNIATENDRQEVMKNPRTVYVKLKDDYLKIWFNRDTLKIILSIENQIESDYSYNLQLKDNQSQSTFLNERYFDENQIRKIDKGFYLFENNYSKNTITSDFYELNQLKINKIIREVLKDETDQTELESKENQFESNYMEQTKRNIFKKLWG